jgi:hypothetical protein
MLCLSTKDILTPDFKANLCYIRCSLALSTEREDVKDVLLLAMMLTGLQADLIEAKEIKRKIVVRQVNGKIEVFGLEDAENVKHTVKNNQNEVNITVTIDQKTTTTGKNSKN